VVETIFGALRQVIDYDAAAIYLVARRTAALEMVSEVGYPEGSESAFDLQIGQGIVGSVAKSGEPVIVPDVQRDPRYVAARIGTRSELAAPLMVEGRVVGVFNLESDHEDHYHEGHLELLVAFASQAALAVERARTARDRVESRRLEKELAIARDIQRSFLPAEAPRIPGFDLAGTSISHDQVGGDYYDFIAVSDTKVGLAIADVSGKGIPAALLMAGFRMSLLAEIRNEFAIRAVMRKVNLLLYESTERDRFVTAFYGLLDWRNSVVTFANAGHNPPLLLRVDGTTRSSSRRRGARRARGGALRGAPDRTRPRGHPGPLHRRRIRGRERAQRPVRTRAHRADRARQPGAQCPRTHPGHRGRGAGLGGGAWPNDDLTLLVVKKLPRPE
jgi:sigma-B regulation protein RsbU (phosphoserine phosphatase)